MAATFTKDRFMSGCCDHDSGLTFEGKDNAYKWTLVFVIGLNALMFFVEMAAGFNATSQALKADALDFLGDSLTYGLTLAVIGMSLRVRATAAMFKGISLLLMGVAVLGMTTYRVFVLGVPNEITMGVIGILALAANVISVMALWRYKDGDSNVHSVWLCSRNDAVGNVIIILAAVAVGATQSRWPDLAVATIMAGLFLHSSTLIIRQSREELDRAKRLTSVEG
ncbi:MAG: cation transporter [Rhodospirillaceae bacterium]|nr:cation transporter [Rhodospirillaceae bacterium]